MRCDSESVFPQWVQRSVSVNRMAARRSLVGIISCITAWHVDFIVSETQALCKLAHTRACGMSGCCGWYAYPWSRYRQRPFPVVGCTAVAWTFSVIQCCQVGLCTPYLLHNAGYRIYCLGFCCRAEGSPVCRSDYTVASTPPLLTLLAHFASICGWGGASCISLRCPAVSSKLGLLVVGVW